MSRVDLSATIPSTLRNAFSGVTWCRKKQTLEVGWLDSFQRLQPGLPGQTWLPSQDSARLLRAGRAGAAGSLGRSSGPGPEAEG